MSKKWNFKLEETGHCGGREEETGHCRGECGGHCGGGEEGDNEGGLERDAVVLMKRSSGSSRYTGQGNRYKITMDKGEPSVCTSACLLEIFLKGFWEEFRLKNYKKAVSSYEKVLMRWEKDLDAARATTTATTKTTTASDQRFPIQPNAVLMARSRLAFLYANARPGTILNIPKSKSLKRHLKTYYSIHPRNSSKSWLALAADQGIKEAQYCLALDLYNGIGYSTPDPSLAFPLAHKAATQGLALAQNLVGNMYIEGSAPGGRDPDKGMWWYIHAGQQKEPTSIYNIGTLFERGLGVAHDFNEAIQWFTRAAALESVNAHSVLGILHHRGLIPSTHPSKAFHHYSQAAFQGHPLSLYNLGRCFQEGFGCARDNQQAYHCFLAAADQEFDKAILALAICHEFGIGVDCDLQQAVQWYVKAAAMGLQEARLRLIPIYTLQIINASKAIFFSHPPLFNSIDSNNNNNPSPHSKLKKPTLYTLPRELQLLILDSLNTPPILSRQDMAELLDSVLDEYTSDDASIQSPCHSESVIAEMNTTMSRVLSKFCSCPSESCDRLVHILYGLQNLEYCL